jgi:hypothetical protein
VGFECCYHYYEKIDGEYNKEETKTFKKKVGDPFDDVPVEKVAASIMAQMARRDILIIDVEIYELTKKFISFKESKSGIIIKNKKFSFDGAGEDSSFIAVEELQQLSAPSTQQQYTVTEFQPSSSNMPAQQLSAAATHPHNVKNNNNKSVKRFVDVMVFLPEALHLHQAKQKNLKFTVNKKYPITEKRPSPTGVGEMFVVQDDTGREQVVSDIYFVPANINLVADRELNFSETPEEKDGGNLYWGKSSNDPGMPDLRRR